MKYRLVSNKISLLLVFLVTITLMCAFTIFHSPRANAAPITDFTAGNIVDDSIFYNKNTMDVGQIQAFLDSLIPNCDVWGTQPSGYGNLNNSQYAQQIRGWPGPPYPCINKYYENPSNNETSYEKGGGAFAGGISAAQIIYNAAQTYNINPQALLVLLKRESLNLTSDNWPLKSQYKYAMGYACPDSGPGYSANCDVSKAGFYKQMMLAAWQLNYYKEHPNDYRYRLGWNAIQYSTEPSCGTKNVFIENMATLSLYIYTPYTPNDAALNAYPGTAPCGAYGNRNFFAYFKEWFGDPRLFIHGGIGVTHSANTWLGKPLINEICNLKDSGCYQVFVNGTIYWTPDLGGQAIRGGIKDKWVANGFENGTLGYPTSGEIATPGGVYQTFQGGTIYWSSGSGAVRFSTPIFNQWTASGGENGFFGRAISESICNLKNNGCYQVFAKGTIYWTSETGAQTIFGGIKDKWINSGFENGTLGYPKSSQLAAADGGVYQTFQGGTIYWSAGSGAVRFADSLYAKWSGSGGEKGFFGRATTDSICNLKNNGCYQLFRTGSIYWTSATGAQTIHGGIKDKWISVGSENGTLGYPTSGEVASDGGVYQTFQGGRINWTASAGASVVYN